MLKSGTTIPRYLLVLGLASGTVLAATGLLTHDDPALPAEAVARVNQRLILRDAWLRAVAAVGSERNAPLTAADQRRILDRLIDEELLVQHGIALGLVEHDARIRNELVSQVMLAAASGTDSEPGEPELQQFYADQQDFFTPPARLRLAASRVDANGRRRDFQPPLPDALLPADKWRNYLGPALAAQASALPAGGQAQLADSNGGKVLIEVLERQDAQAPTFDTIREQVRSEWRRRADEAAVRELLADLRRREKVVVSPELP